MKTRICSECGCEFTTATAHGDFCSSPCRKSFNNRRALRGAELYDLFMALRYERELAAKLKVWKVICRLAAGYRADDIAERDGRKSWRSIRKVLERHVGTLATVISNTTWKRYNG